MAIFQGKVRFISGQAPGQFFPNCGMNQPPPTVATLALMSSCHKMLECIAVNFSQCTATMFQKVHWLVGALVGTLVSALVGGTGTMCFKRCTGWCTAAICFKRGTGGLLHLVSHQYRMQCCIICIISNVFNINMMINRMILSSSTISSEPLLVDDQ